MTMQRCAAGLMAVLVLACCEQAPTRGDGGAGDASRALEDAGTVLDAGPAVPVVRVAAFNVRRFFDTECQSGACGQGDFEALPSQAQFDARAREIAAAIQGLRADVVMLEEIETAACVDALKNALGAEFPTLVLGETGAPGSMDVAVASKGEVVEVKTHRSRVLTRPDGSTTTFSREFLEVRLTVKGQDVTAFATHFRSKVNDDPGRRLAEGQMARTVVMESVADRPNALVVLGGDFNDTPDSAPIQAILGDGGFLRTASDIPESQQGTFVYNGAALPIDHIFQALGGAGAYVPQSAATHGTWGGYGGSDHGAITADFVFPP